MPPPLPKECPACRAVLNPGATYCRYCGARIEGVPVGRIIAAVAVSIAFVVVGLVGLAFAACMSMSWSTGFHWSGPVVAMVVIGGVVLVAMWLSVMNGILK